MVSSFDASGAGGLGSGERAAIPQRQVSAGEIVAPMKAVSEAVGFLGNRLDEASADAFKDLGAKAVQQDGSGNLKFEPMPFVFSAGMRAYNAAGQQGAMAGLKNTIDAERSKLYAETMGNPEAFQAGWRTFQNKIGSTAPPVVREQVRQYAAEQGGQTHNGMVVDQAKTNLSNSKTELVSRVETETNRLMALAREGGTETEAFKVGASRLNDIYGELGKNPLYGVPAEKAAADLAKIRDAAKGEAITGQIDRVYKEKGRVGAEEHIRSTITNNTDSVLSDSERTRLAHQADARVKYLDGQRKAEVEVHRKTVTGITDAWKANTKVPDQIVDDAIAKATSLGDSESVAELNIRRMFAGTNGAGAASVTMTDAERRARGYGGAPATPGQPFVVVGDSLGVGLLGQRGASGNAKENRSPQEVLDILKTARPGSLSGQHVVISSGASNGPAQTELVRQQVEAAKAAGASNVTVLGVGERSDLATAKVNDRIQKSLEGTGARFVPVGATADGVHPSDYGSLWKTVSGGTGGGPAGGGGGGGGAGGITAKASPAVISAIQTAAAKHGVSENLLNRIANVESRFDPNASNPSGATGLFQFMPGTWGQFGNGGNPRDPVANADAAARLVIANRATLVSKLGREPTDGELYLAHQQGAGGASKLLSRPNDLAVDVVGRAAVLQNGGTASMTAGQFAQLWVGKFDRGPGVNVVPGGGYTAPSGGGGSGGRGIPASLAGNPYAMPAYLKAVSEDNAARATAASSIADGIIAGLKDQQAPSAGNLAIVMQEAINSPALAGKRDTIIQQMAGMEAADAAGGMPATQGAAVIAEAKALSQGGSIMQQRIADAAEDHFKKGAEALKNDPWQEASRRQWGAPPPALDFSSPGAAIQAISARDSLSASIAQRTGEGAKSIVAPKEADTFKAALAGAKPEAIGAMFNTLLSSRPEVLQATMADSNFIEAVKGLTRSTDPAQHRAAMNGVTSLKTNDVQRFTDAFGNDMLAKVQGWEFDGWATKDDVLAKRLATQGDGKSDAEKERWRKLADDEIGKSTTPKDVADKLKKLPGPTSIAGVSISPGDRSPEDPDASAVMMGDYRAAFRDAMVDAKGDTTAAEKMALERMATVWSYSKTNNGTFMKHAPEKYLPQVGGSHDYVGRQVQESLREILGPDTRSTLNKVLANDLAGATGIETDIPFRLVPYAGTQSAIRGGRTPPYMISYQDRSGVWQSVNSQGQPYIFVPDVEKARAPERVRLIGLQEQAVTTRETGERVAAPMLQEQLMPGGAPSLVEPGRF